MTKNQVIALFLGTVSCQSGTDLLYAETQSSSGNGPKEFTEPKDPRGEAVYVAPPVLPNPNFAAPASEEGKSFTSSNGPAEAAAPVSAPISWDEPENTIMDMPVPTLYEFDEPVPTLYEYQEEPVPTLYAYEEDQAWEESPMDDYMRGSETELIDFELPPMDMDWDNMDFDLMDEYMPLPENMDWDMLTDPEFYNDQAEEWGYDPIIAESGIAGLPIDFNSTTVDIISWDQEQMRDDFRDYFGWAIMGDVWDSREASTCADRCSEENGMCCVQISMQDMQSQAWNYESYCMYQESIMADYDMEMMGYKLEMVCDQESGPTIMDSAEEAWGGWMGSSAIRAASGIISAAVIFSSVC